MVDVLPFRSPADRTVYMRPARYEQSPRKDTWRYHVHRHQFYEVFWVESGEGLHPINGDTWRLRAGDLVFIRPDDVHGFGNCGKGWRWTNVTISNPAERMLRQRYAKELSFWPWRDGPMPYRTKLSASQVAYLNEQVAMLPGDVERKLDVDWLMGSLIRMLHPPAAVRAEKPTPAWLSDAVDAFAESEDLSVGVQGFVELAGRCREHVNRMVREHYHMTMTDLVLHIRLDRAARLLRQTNREIIDVAHDSGFANLSYFYRTFGRRYGTTPRKYRVQPAR